ncbi:MULTISPECIES: hypothetical protein [Pseudomonas syringae group]|uniref:hypothetical protein n=1 Tax=Pseudomonas syringae group genomosp. 3 TaxID=251701 RepID=UPI00139672B9
MPQVIFIDIICAVPEHGHASNWLHGAHHAVGHHLALQIRSIAKQPNLSACLSRYGGCMR